MGAGEDGDGEGVCRKFLLDMGKITGIGYIKERRGFKAKKVTYS